MQTYLCPASQNDVSVYRNLLFMSSEATNSRADCGFEGVPEPVSKLRVRGIRVFDIADAKRPKLVTTVQTCRGSHTHTVVPKPGDDANVFIYVSGTAAVRSTDEVPGCMDGGIDDPNTARFRLEVIKVPLRTPDLAGIVSSPRIFQGLPVPPRNEERAAQDTRDREAAAAAAAAAGRGGRGGGADGAAGRGRGNQGPPTGPNQCHDITVYPEIGLAGGACGGSACCWISTTPNVPFASTRRPMPTCRSGTRRHSTTTARSSSSATSGAGAASRGAARRTSRSGAPTRSSPSRTAS
jgi:hypothetical protein